MTFKIHQAATADAARSQGNIPNRNDPVVCHRELRAGLLVAY